MGEESPVLSLASSGTLKTKSCTTVAVVGSGNNPSKGRTQVVLDEDAYTAAIGKIIERDFFPDVPKLRAQNEYLDALEANNITKLRELQEKYQHRGGPRSGLHALSTPSTFETPHLPTSVTPAPSESGCSTAGGSAAGVEGSAASEEDEAQQGRRKQSLDSFLHGHTSEDNASFGSMVVEADRRHQERHGWMHKDEGALAAPLDRMLRGAEGSLAIEGPGDGTNAPVTWKYTNRNSLMYIPEGVPLTEEERRERGPGRAIAHEHTRLERAPFDERVNRETLAQAAGVQAKALEGKVGVDGRELQGQESPKVGGFGFVATPSPAPGVSESPLLTWGEIEGTPFLLDGSDTPLPRHPGGPQFRIPEPRSRERLALSLADGVARRSAARRSAALDQMRSSFLSPGASPSPKTPLARLGTMSPAARHLASAKLGISKGVDRALRASYTPGHTPVRDKDGGLAATPTPSPLLPSPASSRRSTRKDGNPEEASSLTDNLLRLPLKRKAAADFF
ncbi:splicing factor ESS-2 homolog [Ixodes scapularis]|uniref:splicing factor ESS-2 homolog n=1 Tax=Ixodes scapularis TaxID=6945 RepID=UPI001A9F1E5D|nr:splicing factor ESS-2 homolog [Ixodes scapularis]